MGNTHSKIWDMADNSCAPQLYINLSSYCLDFYIYLHPISQSCFKFSFLRNSFFHISSPVSDNMLIYEDDLFLALIHILLVGKNCQFGWFYNVYSIKGDWFYYISSAGIGLRVEDLSRRISPEEITRCRLRTWDKNTSISILKNFPQLQLQAIQHIK